jgi:hypothetical protein
MAIASIIVAVRVRVRIVPSVVEAALVATLITAALSVRPMALFISASMVQGAIELHVREIPPHYPERVLNFIWPVYQVVRL